MMLQQREHTVGKMGTLSVFGTEWFRGAVNIVELYGFLRVTAAKSLERHAEIYFLNCTC